MTFREISGLKRTSPLFSFLVLINATLSKTMLRSSCIKSVCCLDCIFGQFINGHNELGLAEMLLSEPCCTS